MIPRSYLALLKADFSSSSKIIVFYGARQVGKTTLVRELLKTQEGRVLEVNADERPYWKGLSSKGWVSTPL